MALSSVQTNLPAPQAASRKRPAQEAPEAAPQPQDKRERTEQVAKRAIPQIHIAARSKHDHDLDLIEHDMCIPNSFQWKDLMIDIHDYLGNGNFGSVFRADISRVEPSGELTYQATAALKIARSKQAEVSMKEEANIGKLLDRKQVPHVTEYKGNFVKKIPCPHCETPVRLYSLAFGLCETDLHERYVGRREKMPLVQLELFYRQMVEALTYIEKEELIHGDIKPDNIFITHDGQFKLGDWNSTAKADKEHKGFYGPTEFLAPDVLLLKKYGITIDSWALFVTLFKVVTFQYLFSHPWRLFGLPKEQKPSDFEYLNSVLQMMAEEIGQMPPEEWSGADARPPPEGKPFFAGNPRTFAGPLGPLHKQYREKYPLPSHHWTVRLRQALIELNMPAEKIAQLLDLGSRILQYKRPLPSEYIRHPFFDAVRV